jgi:hypothetical protein
MSDQQATAPHTGEQSEVTDVKGKGKGKAVEGPTHDASMGEEDDSSSEGEGGEVSYHGLQHRIS